MIDSDHPCQQVVLQQFSEVGERYLSDLIAQQGEINIL